MLLFLVAGLMAFEPAIAAQPIKSSPESNPLSLPMMFSIVRSDAGYCEPNCPEWIYAEGQIDAASPIGLKKILSQAGNRKLPLVVLSPGGNVSAALEMGRIIRKHGLDVEIGATRFSTCTPRLPNCTPDGAAKDEYFGMAFASGAYCWSACPLLLAAGIRRISSEWAQTGVHQVTTVYQRQKVLYREKYRIVNGHRKVLSRKIVSRQDAGTQSTTKLPKLVQKQLIAYFKDMGIEDKLLDDMLSTPPDKIRKLSPQEMLDLHLITEMSTTLTLASPKVCSGATPAANCVIRASAPRPQTAAPNDAGTGNIGGKPASNIQKI
jgi:hypothetical protein